MGSRRGVGRAGAQQQPDREGSAQQPRVALLDRFIEHADASPASTDTPTIAARTIEAIRKL
jgi:hypothetical protein